MEEPPDSVDEKDEFYEYVVNVSKSWVSEEVLSASFSTFISSYWRDNSKLNDVITKVESVNATEGGNGSQTETITNSSGYQCKSCSANYDDFFAYLGHTKACRKSPPSCESDRATPKIKQHPCNTCEKQFTTKSNMYRHMKTHMGRQIHKCYICSKQFSSSTVLMKHIKVHGNLKPYKCNLCNGVFSHTSNLKKHMKRKHAGDSNSTNNMHMKTYEEINMVDFQSMNGETNNINMTLSTNPQTFMNSVHPVNNTNLVNPENTKEDTPMSGEAIAMLQCSANSVDLINIINSNPENIINSVNPVIVANPVVKKKKKVCNICNKQFSTSGNLSRHKKIHNGDKPFHCTECSKQFMEKNDLKRHMKTHELKTINKSNSTAMFDVSETEVGGIESHLLVDSNVDSNMDSNMDPNVDPNMDPNMDSNGDPNTDSNEGKKTHTCSLCDKQFLYKSNYLTHMRIHSSEKPFKCTQCNSRFTQSSNLYRHMKLHKSGKTIKIRSAKSKNVFRVSQALDNSEDKFKTEEKFETETIHFEEKPFVCNYCPEQFTQSNDLKLHLKVHLHERTNGLIDLTELHKCNNINELHNECNNIEEPSLFNKFSIRDKMSHQCDVCSKELSTEGNLRRHMKIHSGLRPFKCEDCDRRFTLQDDLKRHMKIHLSGKKQEEGDDTENENALVNETDAEVEALTDTLAESESQLEEGRDIQHNDLQVFMSTQTPEMQFKKTNDLEMMSNLQTHEKQHMHFVKPEPNTQLEEPKMHVIHNDDFGAGTDAEYLHNNGNGPGTHSSAQLETPEVHIIQSDDFEALTGIEEPQMYFMQDDDLQILSGAQVQERLYNRSETLLRVQINEPVPISSEPHPINDNVVQPIFVYKSEEFVHRDDDDIIVVNSSQVCNLCSEHFSTEEELVEHMNLHSSGNITIGDFMKKHTCNICMKRFSTDGNLNRHMKIHTGEKPFQCEFCGRQFTQSNDLKRHLKIHMREAANGYKYTEEFKQCDADQYPNAMHQYDSPGSSEEGKIFVCSTCGKRYSTIGNLKRHMKLHLGLNASEYQVIDASQSNDVDVVMDELMEVITIGGETFERPVLHGLQSADPNSKELEISPSKSNGKYYMCNVCHKSYTSLGNLKRHLKLNHSGLNESPSNQFNGVNESQSNEFDGSYQRIDVDEVTEPETQAFKGYNSSEKPSVGIPQSIQVVNNSSEKPCVGIPPPIPGVNPESKPKRNYCKRFECSVCARWYSTLKSLKRHLKLHAGLKMSEYKIVDRQLVKQSLGISGKNDEESGGRPENSQVIDANGEPNSHNISMNVKSYLCTVCSKQYTSLGNLKRHLKLNHNDTKDSQSEEIDNSCENDSFDVDTDPSVNESSIAYGGDEKPPLETSDISTGLNVSVPDPDAYQNNSIEEVKTNQLTETNTIECEQNSTIIKINLCNVCGKSYSNIGNLKRHLKINHSIGIDSKVNDLSSDLDKDTNSTAGEKPVQSTDDDIVTKPSFVCTVCSKRFSACKGLNRHMELHKGFKCPPPRSKVHKDTQSNDLKVDVSPPAETSSSEKSLLCDECGKSYAVLGNLKRHMKLYHTDANNTQSKEDENPYKNNALCLDTGYEKNDKLDFEALPSSDITTEVVKPRHKRFICNVCSKPYSSIHNLKRHLKLHPGFKVCQYSMNNMYGDSDVEGTPQSSTPFKIKSNVNDSDSEGTHICDICGKQYASGGNLKRHIKLNHSSGEEDDLPCETLCNICGRQYSSVGNLKRHIKLNHSDKEGSECENICDLCGRQYSSADNLKRHMKLNHSGKEDSKFEEVHQSSDLDEPESLMDYEDCESLQDETLSFADVSTDLISDVSGSSRPASRMPCLCDVCGKPYSTPGNLKRHMKLHLGLNMSQYKVVDRKTYPNDDLKTASFIEYEQSGSSLVENLDPNTNSITDNTNSEKSFACNLCPKSYLCLGNLKRHLDAIHNGGENSQSNEIDSPYENNDSDIVNTTPSFIKEEPENSVAGPSDQDNNGDNNDKDNNKDSNNTGECNNVDNNDSDNTSEYNNVDNNDSNINNNSDNTIECNNAPKSDCDDSRECNIANSNNSDDASEHNILNNEPNNIMECNNINNSDSDNTREYSSDNIEFDNSREFSSDNNIEFDNSRECNNINNSDSDNTIEGDIHNNNNSDNIREGNIHTCTICGNQYTNIGNLQRHMEKHSMDQNEVKVKHCSALNSSRTIKHICPICSKQFSTGSNLSRHMKIHTGEKPYKCKHCSRYFTQSNDLKRHTKTHFL